ncbi:MAG: T9SS type A sorting domain-containing protein [Bacteroidota bacterium]
MGIDFSDVYNVATGDIGIFTTQDGCGDGFNAWELWEDGSWGPVDDSTSWGQELEFYLGATIQTNTISSTREENLQFPLQISPNPTHGQVNLSFQLPASAELAFNLLDFTGRQVYTEALGYWPVGAGSVSIELAELPAGMYAYQLQAGNHTTVGRLMVE